MLTVHGSGRWTRIALGSDCGDFLYFQRRGLKYTCTKNTYYRRTCISNVENVNSLLYPNNPSNVVTVHISKLKVGLAHAFELKRNDFFCIWLLTHWSEKVIINRPWLHSQSLIMSYGWVGV